MPDPFGPTQFAAEIAKTSPVSHETLSRLETYVALLTEWNARQNMVSKSSLAEVWQRHIWDSAQLAPLLPPEAKTLVDLGSGAGFPALVLGTMRPGLKITLYESVAKKCRFLAEAAGVLGLDVEIRNARIEDSKLEGFDVLTARALAPLYQLLSYAARFQAQNTVNLLLKGQDIEVELKDTTKSWRMQITRHASQTGPGTILEIRKLRHVQSGRPLV